MKMKIKIKEILLPVLRIGDMNKYYPLIFTLIFVSILIQYTFNSLEAFFYDMRVRLDIGIKKQDNIVIVTMDEESDAYLGEKYPYTYATHNRFISKLIKAHPSIITFLVAFGPPDSDQENIEIHKLKHLVQDYASSEEIEKGLSHPGKFRFGTQMVEGIGEQWPPDPLRELGHSPSLLHLDSTSFSKDDICRKAILNISGEDSFHLWVANRFREQIGEKPLSANAITGNFYSKEADATFTLFRYYTSPKVELSADGFEHSEIKRISYHQVVVGNFSTDFFKDKIVLIGPQYISRSSDYILTPFNRDRYEPPVPAINVHAEIIESLIQNKAVHRLSRPFTNLLCFILALVLSLVNSRVSPVRGLFINLGTILSLLIISYILFAFFDTGLYVTYPLLTVFIVYYIWVPFRAIAEYQTRYAIEEESKMAKEIDHLKKNFISLMSHDLKTPVAKIAGNADILSNYYEHDDKVRGLLKNIIDATKELNNFITGILDFIKIESERFGLRAISKDINTIIEDVILSFKYEASNKNIQIISSLAPLYPINLDPDLIKRVLANLIENAIKYSGKGSTINVKTWDEEKWVYVEIKDNGIGISNENLEHIFDKFFRVKNDASITIKGFGLGLYLVKYFVELHGGKISASSELGKGSTFLITLKNA